MPRQKNYTFTINNPTEDDLTALLLFRDQYCQYMAYSLETGESNTPHYQGYFKLKRESTMKAIKSAGLPRAHLEIQRGSDLENEAYISKQNAPAVWGKLQVIVPNLEQVILFLEQNHLKWIGPYYTHKEAKLAWRLHQKTLLRKVCNECPVQYIRHRQGIKQYIEDYYKNYQWHAIEGEHYYS